MTLPSVDLQGIAVGLLGLGMLVKGWAEKKRTAEPCAECPLTDKLLDGLGKMVDATVGPRAIDPVDNEFRWYARDIGKDAVARQVRVAEKAMELQNKVAKENHDDHLKIVNLLGIIITKLNGRQAVP